MNIFACAFSALLAAVAGLIYCVAASLDGMGLYGRQNDALDRRIVTVAMISAVLIVVACGLATAGLFI